MGLGFVRPEPTVPTPALDPIARDQPPKPRDSDSGLSPSRPAISDLS